MTEPYCVECHRQIWRCCNPDCGGPWYPVSKTVNCVTSDNPEMSDTVLTGRQYRPPTEGKQMFRTDKIDYVVLATLLLALVAAMVR